MFTRKFLIAGLSCAVAVSAYAQEKSKLSTLNNAQPITIENYPLSQAASADQGEWDNNTPPTDTVKSVGGYNNQDASAVDDVPGDSSMVNQDDDEDGNTAQQPSKPNQPSKAGAWTLQALNNAQWTEGLQRGQFPVYAKAQVLLNRRHASPGAIDGTSGKNTLKAISAYQTMNHLTVNGILDKATWDHLVAHEKAPAFVMYTITAADLKGPYAAGIPSNYADQAKMKGLYYTRVTEMLGERFHMDEAFLKKLNPKATFKKAGEKIIVANVRNDLPEDIHLIIAHKGAKQLYLFNKNKQMIASFPATIGSSDTPSPTGTYTIRGVAANPWYSYNPKNFVQGNNMKPLSLPPGPNNPVGNVWIGLSKPSFGIHGTPNPSLISKTASHGCIRLTNWDANDLARRVGKGITVKFLE